MVVDVTTVTFRKGKPMEWHNVNTPLSQFAVVGEEIIVSVHTRIQEQDDETRMPYSETHEVFVCDVVEFDNVLCLKVTNDVLSNQFVAFNMQQQKVILENDKEAFVYYLMSEPKFATYVFAKWANVNSISIGDMVNEKGNEDAQSV